MKTLYPIVLTLFLTTSLYAQLEKGMYSLGGGFEMANQWQKRQDPVIGLPARGFSLNLDPMYSIFLSDHWMLSASIGGSAYSSGDIQADNSFTQPGIRYYFNPEAERLHLFAGLSPSINLGDLEDSRFNLNLGANQFISNELTLEGSLNYSMGAGSNPLVLGLYLRPFLRKGSKENADPGSIFQKGNLILQQNVATATLIRNDISLAISPGLALFLTDRTLIGGTVGASIFLRTQTDQQSDASSFLGNIYLRQYLISDPKKWNWFGELELSYSINESSLGERFDFQGQGATLDASFGASVFISESVAIEPFVRGQYYLGGSSSLNSVFNNPMLQEADFENGPFNLALGVQLNLFLVRNKN
jgi:hypothetical protein